MKGFITICFVAFILPVVYTQEDNRKVLIKRFDQCDNMPDTPLKFVDLKVTQTGRNAFRLDGKVRFTSVVGADHDSCMAYLTAIQCPEVENPDSCEAIVQDFEVGNFCDMVASEDDLWVEFIRHIKLTKCPIQPQEFICDNLQVNASLILNFVPLDEAFFKINLYHLEKGVQSSCLNLEIQVTSS